MNSLPRTRHSVDAIFSVLLFGIFTFMLLLLILFSAQTYRVSVQNQEENQNLHTAMTYITTKIRQHDERDEVYLDTIETLPALCIKDRINNQIFTTYIYLDNTELKELFTVPNASVSSELGTTIAELKEFHVEKIGNDYLKLCMEDFYGNHEELLLHPSIPNTEYMEDLS